MPDLRIPSSAARRITRIAQRRRHRKERVLAVALKAGLDYEEWFEMQVKKGLSDLKAGRVLTHADVLKSIARRKAMLARALKKAA
jgi:predicted transcriptional regulator